MIPLLREKLKAIVPGVHTKLHPDILLQMSLGGDPWRVAVASMLLCRTTPRRAEPVFLELLRRYPGPEYLCRAECGAVEKIVQSCGLHRRRARQLIRFSSLWLGDGWEDLRELPGVGMYVADAVGLVCFGCIELESRDGALRDHARTTSK